MGYTGGGVNGALRWKDLALDILLPVDEEKEMAEKAAHARKMASGITSHPPHPPQQPQQPQVQTQGEAAAVAAPQVLGEVPADEVDNDENEDEGNDEDTGDEDGDEEDE